MTAMRLGDATVGELDTASIATTYGIQHIRLLSLRLYCLRIEIMAQQTMPRLFVKKMANLTCRRVRHQMGLIKQGSSLALANLLKASSFLQKASRNSHHLLFLACGNKSLSYQPNYATQHKLYGKQCRS